jgi:magnesium chelatase subunit I
VEIRTPTDLDQRIEIVRRRDAFERDETNFVAAWKRQEMQLRRRIVAARALLPRVAISDEALAWAARLCMDVGTDGLRGELTLARAARALAAMRGRLEVQREDLVDMAPAALRHRLRRDPMDETGSSARIERAMRQQEAARA